jgi:hypothetical protein
MLFLLLWVGVLIIGYWWLNRYHPEEKRPMMQLDENGFPICPVCGSEADTIYQDMYGRVCGCQTCMNVYDAYDFAMLIGATRRDDSDDIADAVYEIMQEEKSYGRDS